MNSKPAEPNRLREPLIDAGERTVDSKSEQLSVSLQRDSTSENSIQRIQASLPAVSHAESLISIQFASFNEGSEIPAQLPAKNCDNVRLIAQQGVAGTGSAYPHARLIQQSFGQHSIRHVKAYSHAPARQACRSLSAKAYATGPRVAFAEPNPSLFTAAHEAAHVIQQAGGVQLRGGVGEINDRYEQHANEVALGVVQGDSVERQLDQFRKPPKPMARESRAMAPVQRLMGIEAELSVPVSKAGAAATADQRIRNFFSGGVQEATAIAAPAKGFRKETDHDPLSDAIENSRLFLCHLLTTNAQPPIPALAGGHKVANLEYVTDRGGAFPPAYDETDWVELNAFRQSITDMATDMGIVYAGAKANVVAAAGVGAGHQIGLPPVNDWKAFAKANGISEAHVLGRRNHIENQINDNLYVQISAGILPKRISKFLRGLGSDRELAELPNLGLPGGSGTDWVKLLTKGAADAADRAVSRTTGLDRDVRNSKSLRGLVSLMMANIFGLYFSARRLMGGAAPQVKNMVAALPRTPLTNVLLELDVTKRPDQWAAAERTSLANEIIAAANRKLDAAPVFRGAGDDVAANAFIGGGFNWHNWVTSILTNQNDTIFQNLGGITQVNPHDHPRSKTINPVAAGGAADHPRPIAKAGGAPTAKSGAVVTELRFIHSRPQPNQLLALVNRAVQRVNKSNS